MHRVGRTRQVEDQLVARGNDLGVAHTLLRTSQAGVGPLHTLGAIKPEVPSFTSNSSAKRLRAAVSISSGTVSLAGGPGVLSGKAGAPDSVAGSSVAVSAAPFSASLPSQAAVVRAIPAASAMRSMNPDNVDPTYLDHPFTLGPAARWRTTANAPRESAPESSAGADP